MGPWAASLRMVPPPGSPAAEGFVTGVWVDEGAFSIWAASMGVPVERLVMAVVAGSEITSLDPARRREQGLVMECLRTRLPFVGFPSGFPGRPGSLFSVAVAPRTTTGPQSEGRPFSSSRIAVGEALRYLLDIALEVENRLAITAGHVTSFVHMKPAQLARIKGRWKSLGYQLVATFPHPNGKIGAFFAPTPSKRRALERAARKASA